MKVAFQPKYSPCDMTSENFSAPPEDACVNSPQANQASLTKFAWKIRQSHRRLARGFHRRPLA